MVVRCVDASSCSGSTPFCDASSGVCRACGASDCTTPQICDATPGDPGIGQCVECVVDSDCGGELCQSNKCVPCTKHTDCAKTTGICDIDGGGKCAPADKIIYVNNSTTTPGVTCSDTKHASTLASPYCQITEALSSITDTSSRAFISVVGNGTTAAATYHAVSWTSGPINVAIVGPGKMSAMPAYVNDVGVSAVSVAGPGASVTVIVDGLELRGLSNPGVQCVPTSGVPTLTLRDSLIEQSDETGIESTNCALVVDQSILKNNTGSLTVTGGSFNVQNTVFTGGQSTTTAPIELSTSASGVFSFNTVVGYTNTGTAIGGIDCGTGVTQAIMASIVVGNTQQASSQFGPKCTLTSTVVGSTDMTTGGIKVDPVFQSDGYHLVVGSNPDIVNQLTSGPAFDIDDIARPINAKWDIGADEAE